MGRFTRAYLEAALWASTDEGGEPLDGLYTVDDLAPEALAAAKDDCEDFQATYGADFAGREARAGADFWLTRNRHGAGFWDGDWPGDVAKRLTEASHAYGSVDLYVGDDGKLYFTS